MPTNIRIIPELDADVIVVGAGPAGCATAIHLAHAGIKVLILECAQFPRDKICGDFIGPVGLMELKKLGISSSPAYKNSPVIRQAGVYLNGELLIHRNFPEIDYFPAHGRVIPRKELDHLLFEKADIDFLKDKADIAVIGTQTLKTLETEGIDAVGRFIRSLK